MSFSLNIAQKLLQINAIKLNPQNPFTWASGLRSPIYCDNRLSLSYPEIRNEICEGLAELSNAYENIDVIAGVATAGIAHGMLLAERLNKPFAYVRSKAKSHGRQNQIEGKLEAGQRVLMVEDLISTGGSALQAVQAVRDAGCDVLGVLAIFTYGFPKSVEAFAEHNCRFSTITNYSELLNCAVEKNYISAAEHEILSDWSRDPEHWFSNLK